MPSKYINIEEETVKVQVKKSKTNKPIGSNEGYRPEAALRIVIVTYIK
jgi:hypothetical protein